MRTTIDLDPGVLRDLRQRSRHERKSMGRLASELLARSLAGEVSGGNVDQPLTWIAADLGRPLVDLEDAEALRSVLDAGR